MEFPLPELLVVDACVELTLYDLHHQVDPFACLTKLMIKVNDMAVVYFTFCVSGMDYLRRLPWVEGKVCWKQEMAMRNDLEPQFEERVH